MQSIINQLPEDSLLLEPRLVFDLCLVGVTDSPDDHWPRKEKKIVAIYDMDKTIEAIANWLDCSEEEAIEWFSYNTSGAWMGEGTPTFRSAVLLSEDQTETSS